MNLHLETLTDEGRDLFPLLGNFSDFYLAGGTALALQIGHRVSVDFDFFSGDSIKRALLTRVEKVFFGKRLDISVNNGDELTFFMNGVKFTFLHYPFPILLSKVCENDLCLLSAKEIGATKAYTIGRRGELKDYVDVYFLLRSGYVTLDEVVDLAQKKYGDAFDKRLFFEQLIYFDDIEDVGIRFLAESVSKDELKGFFENEIRKIGI